MTVYKPKRGRTFRYDFWWEGDRYEGNTGQLTRKDALEWERQYRVSLARQTGGLPLRPKETPRFSEWAAIFYAYQKDHVKRPDYVLNELRMVLEFWGDRPKTNPELNPKYPKMWRGRERGPYLNLRLADPIVRPQLLLKFEKWMKARGGSAWTHGHYLSVLSSMYRVAMLPQFRVTTGITTNPFAGITREKGRRRLTVVSVEELRRWLAHASYHVRLAAAIGALAPKLRTANILALEWKRDFASDLRWVVVDHHKTDESGMPLVTPVSAQLREILIDAKRRNPQCARVVVYRGKPVKSIRGGVRRAAERAGLEYGLQPGGVTFHSIRHGMATLLAERGEDPALRREVMGHADQATTDIYTHLRPVHEVAPLERHSAAVPLLDIVTHPRRRAAKMPIPYETATGKSAGTVPEKVPTTLRETQDSKVAISGRIGRKVQ